MASKKKARRRCPFPRCRRYEDHDGVHSLRTVKRTVNPKSLANLKPFEPGVSGNPAGRPKDVYAELVQEVFAENRDAIKKAIRKKLVQGSLGAFGEFGDRGFGKLAQPLVGGGEGANPLVVKIDC